MPVASAPGQIMNPIGALLGIQVKYDTSSHYLLNHNYLHVRTVARVNTEIFFT